MNGSDNELRRLLLIAAKLRDASEERPQEVLAGLDSAVLESAASVCFESFPTDAGDPSQRPDDSLRSALLVISTIVGAMRLLMAALDKTSTRAEIAGCMEAIESQANTAIRLLDRVAVSRLAA